MKILFKLVFRLENRNIEFAPNGPLFHRWLPNGEVDAITLDTRLPGTLLKVWFKRWGVVIDREISFKLNEEKVDSEIMSKQGVLDGGPLIGKLEMEIDDTKELDVLKDNQTNDPKFIDIARRVIKSIDEPVCDFLHILRVPYGQYWIIEPQKWNSLKTSAFQYCIQHEIKFSLDEGINWRRLEPGERALSFTTVMGGGFEQNLTKDDWKKIADLTRKGSDRSISLTTLVQAHNYRSEGEYKHAILEGVTALDISVNEYLNKKLSRLNLSVKDIGDIAGAKLPIKCKLVASFVDSITEGDLKQTLELIEMRNEIAHRGLTPLESDAMERLPALFKFVVAVTGYPAFKFPKANSGNAIYPDEKWGEYYAKRNV